MRACTHVLLFPLTPSLLGLPGRAQALYGSCLVASHHTALLVSPCPAALCICSLGALKGWKTMFGHLLSKERLPFAGGACPALIVCSDAAAGLRGLWRPGSAGPPPLLALWQRPMQAVSYLLSTPLHPPHCSVSPPPALQPTLAPCWPRSTSPSSCTRTSSPCSSAWARCVFCGCLPWPAACVPLRRFALPCSLAGAASQFRARFFLSHLLCCRPVVIALLLQARDCLPPAGPHSGVLCGLLLPWRRGRRAGADFWLSAFVCCGAPQLRCTSMRLASAPRCCALPLPCCSLTRTPQPFPSNCPSLQSVVSFAGRGALSLGSAAFRASFRS